MPQPSLLSLLGEVHRDEEGTVSLETILIIGAIALPVLIFVLLYAWPAIKSLFWQGMEDVQEGAQDAALP
jgi:hypothetical protein